MEPDQHPVFDDRESGHCVGGIAEQEFFAGFAGLEIFVAWPGLYGAVLLVEQRVDYDLLCGACGCVAGDSDDCEGVAGPGFREVGGVDIGRGVFGFGAGYLCGA